jgi:CRISPR system Cascade subunit CasC
MAKNKYSGINVEFHILQSFPVTCLNRDDVGSPKTAIVGGVQRARVSSQAWKRPVRLSLNDFSPVTLGYRTKLVSALIQNECKILGATDAQAKSCAERFEAIFLKKSNDSSTTTTSKGKGKKTEQAELGFETETEEKTEKESEVDSLLFLAPNEVRTLAEAFASNGFDEKKTLPKEDKSKRSEDVVKILKNSKIDAIDIALFGRMIAQASSLSVEAATSFAHAISTHKVIADIDLFSALDDDPLKLKKGPGSSHLGALEFNSATYYRYVNLNLGQLYENLQGQCFKEAIEAFVKALYLAVPSGRQNTMAGYNVWDYAKILVRKGQPIQMGFENPVKASGEGFLKPSIQTLQSELSKKEKMFGSLFGKMAELEIGNNDNSIDDLISLLVNSLELDKD